MVSPVNKILLEAANAVDSVAFHRWLAEHAESLVEDERKMVALAYVAGIDMDWGDEAWDTEEDAKRDPEYGYEYFDCRYGAKQ